MNKINCVQKHDTEEGVKGSKWESFVVGVSFLPCENLSCGSRIDAAYAREEFMMIQPVSSQLHTCLTPVIDFIDANLLFT